MSNPNAWVTAREAAQILGLTRHAVYKQIAKGIIPESAIRPRVEGGSILISRSYLLPPANNISQFPQPSSLSDADVQRIADAVARRLAAGLIGAA